MKKFRNKTPQSLIKMINDIDSELNKSSSLSKLVRAKLEHFQKCFKKLASHRNMDTVWKRLKKRTQQEWTDTWVLSDSGLDPVYDDCLDYAINIALFLERSPWEFLTKTERANKATELKTKLNNLARDIEKFQLGQNVLKYIDNDELQSIYELKQSVSHEERFKSYLYFPVSLSLVMKRCANDITEQIYSPSLLPQPARKSADFLLFVRKLSKWNKKIYGFYLHEITANVADIFFPDEEATESKIQGIVKNTPNS